MGDGGLVHYIPASGGQVPTVPHYLGARGRAEQGDRARGAGKGKARAGRKLLCGGDGTEAHLPNPPPPPPPWSLCREGGLGWRCPTCRDGGGGATPTYMAQNDPHVALIILTTHMWGKIFSRKKFSGPKFVFRRLWWQHPSLHKTKGPARKPISGTPPPLLRRAPMPSPPPPPPQRNFRVA